MKSTIILGAGITGLCAGQKRGRTIYEGLSSPGGLCASYYVGSNAKLDIRQRYRFEKGGGHWIFGKDNDLLRTIKTLSPVKKYERKASVYFRDQGLYVPYPLQNHAYVFSTKVRNKIRDDMRRPRSQKVPSTLKEWLNCNYGQTLCELFFSPFHECYTAGLTEKVVAQDLFKNPADRTTILQGLERRTSPYGYNTTFVYPERGLGHLVKKIADQCDVRYNKKAVRIDIIGQKIFFQDGSSVAYKKLISTLPLSEVVKLCGLRRLARPDPHTSVLVFNIGAQKGPRCPEDHWIYVPGSQSGFHRVGFYSNVDASFLPENRRRKDRVSLYVETAFLPGNKPDESGLATLGRKIVNELKAWKYINRTEVLSSTWIDYAYTWRSPGSSWREEAITYLKNHGIHSIGRFGAWRFQGILESMKDGYLS